MVGEFFHTVLQFVVLETYQKLDSLSQKGNLYIKKERRERK